MSAHVTFTGIGAILSASFTYNAHGIVPSSATITFPPQPLNTMTGTLSFVDPDRGSVINFDNCLLDSVTSQADSSGGWIYHAIVIDERWSWQHREIYGAYNLRLPDGKLDPLRMRTPHQLATLLLQAMGVQNFSVGELPNTGFPECRWEYANAATELNRLVESRGCRVVRLLNGTVRICRVGVGSPLPYLPDLAPSVSANPANKPNVIRAVFAPTEWQTRFKLRCVAEEPDGRYVPYQQASYRPQGGWEGETPGSFIGVPDEYPPPQNRPSTRQLTLKSVFRMYQIDPTQSLSIPGIPGVQLQHILPIKNTLLETVMVAGKEERKPAFVKGVHVVDSKISIHTNTPATADVNVPFSFDAARGMIIFNDYVYKTDGGGTPRFQEADLWLTCSHGCLNPATGLPHRYTQTVMVPGSLVGGGTKVVNTTELNLQYRSNGTNQAEIATEANIILQGELQSYQPVNSNSLLTPGLVSVQPDGAIQQLSWQCSGTGPATTMISRNAETDPYLPDYQTRQEMAAGNKAKVDKLENQVVEIGQTLHNMFNSGMLLP